MKQFCMPSLGADMDAGKLVEWLKSPGDVLKRGDIIAVVETQKGAIEIEVFEDGILSETLVQPGDEAPVGHPIALIDDLHEAHVFGPESKAPTAQPPAATSVKITPAARRLAQDRGLDLTSIEPGPDGVVGLREVEAGLSRPPRQPQREPARSEMRKAIASAMARSNNEIPHYYVTSTIDMSATMAWLAKQNSTLAVAQRLLYAVPILRAVALCLRKFDDMNGTYVGGTFVPAPQINIGVAIALRGGGLITPALLEADAHEMPALMERLNDLVRRARTGGLRSSELSSGTVTLTNLGERTADTILPIIYPPQVAIIGCGQIRKRPWVVEGRVEARQLMDATVAGDHRASDGRRGAQFLNALSELLAKPEEL